MLRKLACGFLVYLHMDQAHSGMSFRNLLERHVSILVITGISYTTSSTSGEFRNVPCCESQRDAWFHDSDHTYG